MKRVEGWLRKQAAYEAWRPTLEQALLTKRFARYAFYRLRYFSMRVAFRSLLYLVEMLFFYQVFASLKVYASVLLVRHACALSSALWWGGLEVLRGEVRRLAQEPAWMPRTWERVRDAIQRWVLWTAAATLAALLVAAALVLLAADRRGYFRLSDLYILACVGRLVLDLTVRAYHSGIYALRRVYIPFWAFFVPDLLEVAGVVGLWPLVGPASFAWMLPAAGVMHAGMQVYFTRETYRTRGIPPLDLGRIRESLRRLPRPRELAAFVRFGLANSLGGVDSALIIALIVAGRQNGEIMAAAAFFHLLQPFTAAVHDWARLFYFDFVKLQLRQSVLFHRRYEALLRRTALGFAALTWTVAVAWGALFYQGTIHWMVYALFAPFFVVRAYLALFQVQAFSYQRLAYIARTGSLLGVGLVFVTVLRLDLLATLASLTAFVGLALALFRPPRTEAEGVSLDSLAKELVTLPRWMALIAGAREPVRVGSATVRQEKERPVIEQVGEIIAARLKRGAACIADSSRIVWFEAGDEARWCRAEDLVVACAGTLDSLRFTARVESGQEGLREGLAKGLFGRSVESGLEGKAQGAEEIQRRFQEMFPDGVVFDTVRGEIRRGRLTHSEVYEIMRSASGSAFEGMARRGLAYETTTYCPAGEPELVFLVEREEDRSARARWRRYIEGVSLRASVQAAAGGEAALPAPPGIARPA